MTIIVKTIQEGKTLNEWAVIELQGDLEIRNNEKMLNHYVGDVYYNKYGCPTIIIGHHILQGHEQKLDKPFAVIEKLAVNESVQFLQKPVNSQIENGKIDRSILDNTITLENKIRKNTDYYVVRAVCTKKLIFKIRPKPIIGNIVSEN